MYAYKNSFDENHNNINIFLLNLRTELALEISIEVSKVDNHEELYFDLDGDFFIWFKSYTALSGNKITVKINFNKAISIHLLYEEDVIF